MYRYVTKATVKPYKVICQNALSLLVKNSLITKDFSNGQDSTASITYIFHDKKGNTIFHFDLGIIRNNSDGTSSRLINDKKEGRYIWNQIFDSRALQGKVRAIHQRNQWNELRAAYLDLKNGYLEKQISKPSYEIYSEAVNQIFNRR